MTTVPTWIFQSAETEAAWTQADLGTEGWTVYQQLMGLVPNPARAAAAGWLRTRLGAGANRGDYAELPDYLKDGITAHFASHYRDVAKVLFQ